MGTDIHLLFEHRDATGAVRCLGAVDPGARDHRAFSKIQSELMHCLPDDAGYEARHAYESIQKAGYFGFGWMAYDRFLKHSKHIWDDPFKKKLREGIRVYVWFDN